MAESDIVVSIEALEEMPPALRAFRSFVADHLYRVQSDLRRVRETMKEARSDASREVRRISSEIDCADEEDDTSGLEYDLSEARERLSRIERATRNTDGLVAAYEREAGRMRLTMENQVPRAESHLMRKIDELHSMHAIQSGDQAGWGGGAAGASSAVSQAAACAADVADAAGVDLTASPLPSGYAWAKLSDMDLDDALTDVRTAEDFRPHATYDMLTNGLGMLQSTVLPAIAQHGYTADNFFFDRQDAASGRDPEHGARRVFDSFFGSDAIALQRGANGKLSVINGRHRLKVANDAGWLAVPVKITKGGV
jgi:hypothetical protein